MKKFPCNLLTLCVLKCDKIGSLITKEVLSCKQQIMKIVYDSWKLGLNRYCSCRKLPIVTWIKIDTSVLAEKLSTILTFFSGVCRELEMFKVWLLGFI